MSSFRDLAAQRLDAEAEELINGLVELAKGTGTVTRAFQCPACGQSTEHEVRVADAKTSIEILKLLDERGHGRPKEPDKQRSTTDPLDLTALTNEQLRDLTTHQE